jgi:uncharacterized protein
VYTIFCDGRTGLKQCLKPFNNFKSILQWWRNELMNGFHILSIVLNVVWPSQNNVCLVRKDMDVNEYKRQSNFTLRHRLMLQTGLILLF